MEIKLNSSQLKSPGSGNVEQQQIAVQALDLPTRATFST